MEEKGRRMRSVAAGTKVVLLRLFAGVFGEMEKIYTYCKWNAHRYIRLLAVLTKLYYDLLICE